MLLFELGGDHLDRLVTPLAKCRMHGMRSRLPEVWQRTDLHDEDYTSLQCPYRSIPTVNYS